MDEFDAVYCPTEDIVVIDDTDFGEFDGHCSNCLADGCVIVTVKEKKNGTR